MRRRIEYFYEALKRDYIKDTRDFEAKIFVSEEPVGFRDKNRYEFKNIKKGSYWGRNWQCAWFHLRGRIPEEWKKETVIARLNINGEGLVFSADRMPLQGITDHSIFCADYINDILPLYDSAVGGEDVELWLDAGANNYFGMEMAEHPRLDTPIPAGKTKAEVKNLELCSVDENLRQLEIDIQVALSLLKIYSEDNYRYRQLLTILGDAMDIYCGNRENAFRVREFLQQRLFSSKAYSICSQRRLSHSKQSTLYRHGSA